MHKLPADSASSTLIWNNFQSGPWPYILHFTAVGIGALAIVRGIRSIERVNKILIPVLILIIITAVIRSLFLPGAFDGIAYLFHPQWSQLGNPGIWLQALTQNAWDTGAGWGLFLTYAAYMKAEHGTVKNAFITGIGNNTISLLMAIMIFGTVFSVLQSGMGYTDSQVLDVMKTSGPASTGLTFIWMPQLFARMSFGQPLAVLFFLGLTFAGFSSMISMFEMSARVLVDRGMKRTKAVWIVVAVVYVLGIPSAMNLNFLSNQDFVWGIGLMISGAFIAVNIARYGAVKLRTEMEKARIDWEVGRWWDQVIIWFVPVGTVVLLAWWLTLSVTQLAPGSWYNPFSPFSIMSCLVQWLIVTLFFVIINRKL
jgi:NSS family neurotransmitter:Na+ symporter